ncbi:MAG: YjbQ family protein [Candidatus Lokiarchaeota archaeon]|nr:YjbQ family protein [Candidatus Lokiarchaeota archaeon]
MEKLYLPDFNCIFGQKFANPFLYNQVDTMIWPILNDMDASKSLESLLELKNSQDKPYFYRRKLNLDDLRIELNCSGIGKALVQAMALGREYGIDNNDVINMVKQDPNLFSGILSFDLSDPSLNSELISEIRNFSSKIPICGIALYPSFTRQNLNDEENQSFNSLIKYCLDNNLFIKIDVGNSYLPKNFPKYTSVESVKEFLSKNQSIPIVLSGLDISGDFSLYYQLLKYYNNLWIEIDPRSFGGMTPTDSFLQIFNIKGFIQNTWHRLIIGSATPTLESSQIVRGFLEATEILPFAQKCILRTWAFRNINRLNENVFKPTSNINLSLYNPIINHEITQTSENSCEVNITYEITLRSYSITQLIFLTTLIKELFIKANGNYPDLKNGEIFLRSFHTTTSFIINEHEFGNYLDLHYKFAEISKQESSQYLHTVRALENRADFNHYDHELASTFGSRDLTIPIINNELAIGSRENFYVLTTFGPRTFKILIKIRFRK